MSSALFWLVVIVFFSISVAAVASSCWLYGRAMKSRKFSMAAFHLAMTVVMMEIVARNVGRLASWLVP